MQWPWGRCIRVKHNAQRCASATTESTGSNLQNIRFLCHEQFVTCEIVLQEWSQTNTPERELSWMIANWVQNKWHQKVGGVLSYCLLPRHYASITSANHIKLRGFYQKHQGDYNGSLNNLISRESLFSPRHPWIHGNRGLKFVCRNSAG